MNDLPAMPGQGGERSAPAPGGQRRGHQTDLLMTMAALLDRSRAERKAQAIGSVAWVLVWMFPLLTSIGAIASGRVTPAWPAIAGLVVFVPVYLFVMVAGF